MQEFSEAAPQSLNEDEAYLLSSRGVLRLSGEQAGAALQACITAQLPTSPRGATFAAILDDDGFVAADLFVIADGDDFLIDCDRADVDQISRRFQLSLAGGDAELHDESRLFRVFGLLNNQLVFENGAPFIRYADKRRHEMGSRVLRPATAPESAGWRHEFSWRAHAYRLGIATGADIFSRVKIRPVEAGFHALNGLDPAFCDTVTRASIEAGPRTVDRRVLPFRVEPAADRLAPLVGGMIEGDEIWVGEVLASQKLFGLALVDIAAWRAALERGALLKCAGEQVLVTWPTWIARESEGRRSPAGDLDVDAHVEVD